MKKKIKNRCSQPCTDAIGEEVEPVAGTSWDERLLYDFGEATIGDTDDDGQPNGSFSVFYTIANELFAITP